MRDIGNITLWNVECIFVEESDGISIIPKDGDKIKDFRTHFDDQDFILMLNAVQIAELVAARL